jgi:hypothetical protein
LPSSNPDEFSFELTDPTTPLSDSKDYLILRNDWPYGLEPGLFHIVVWSKHRLPVDWNNDGALTPGGHKMVEDFVHKHITEPLGAVGEDKVIWFKNYGSTSSIRTVDHMHVIVRGVEQSELNKILGRVES